MNIRKRPRGALTRREAIVGGAATSFAFVHPGQAESTLNLPASRSEITTLPELPIVRSQFVPHDKDMLFYAQNSINNNVLVYALNWTKNGDLDSDEPVTVYWRRYSDHGQRRELNFFERYIALGLVSNVEAPGRWSIRMIGWRERAVNIEIGADRRPRATFEIDHRPLTPLYVWVEADGGRFIPSIRHVDLFARAESGKGVVRERIFFS
jgi:hypothetical protein